MGEVGWKMYQKAGHAELVSARYHTRIEAINSSQYSTWGAETSSA
jgi:hypothetical protein